MTSTLVFEVFESAMVSLFVASFDPAEAKAIPSVPAVIVDLSLGRTERSRCTVDNKQNIFETTNSRNAGMVCPPVVVLRMQMKPKKL